MNRKTKSRKQKQKQRKIRRKTLKKLGGMTASECEYMFRSLNRPEEIEERCGYLMVKPKQPKPQTKVSSSDILTLTNVKPKISIFSKAKNFMMKNQTPSSIQDIIDQINNNPDCDYLNNGPAIFNCRLNQLYDSCNKYYKNNSGECRKYNIYLREDRTDTRPISEKSKLKPQPKLF